MKWPLIIDVASYWPFSLVGKFGGINMKLTIVILFLAVCQQISAAGLPVSLLSAKSQLAELKMKLDADIAGLPVRPKVVAAKPKVGLPALSGKVPDIAGRKATLESLKAKLTAMQEQVKSGQPGAQFLVGMKQVLEESSNVEMTDFKVPAFKPKSYKAAKSSMKAAEKALPKIELVVNRNVQNFTAEMFRLHEEGTDLHRRMLEDKRVQRNEMTDVVFDIFLDMVQLLGEGFEIEFQMTFSYFVFDSRRKCRRPLANPSIRSRHDR
jgi:hypothetical protein